MLRLFILFFLSLHSFCIYAEEESNIKSVYLTWTKDPTKTMTIRWITKNEFTEDFVEYHKASEDKRIIQEGQRNNLPNKSSYVVHHAELQDLEPDCVYNFFLPGEEKSFSFKTFPKDLKEPVVFVVGGDTSKEGMDAFEEMNKDAALCNPKFILFGGDLAYASSRRKSGHDKSRRWRNWLTSYYKTMKTEEGFLIPLLVTIGNHDVNGSFEQSPNEAPFYYSLFAMPGLPGYNVLRFNRDMSIYLLDSEITNPVAGKQTEWLERELLKDKDISHKFAIYHVPAFPSVRNYDSDISALVRKHWVPLFEKYNVRTAFENHDHAYKRTHLLKEEKVDPEGVLYIGDGSYGVTPRIPKKAEMTTYLAKTLSQKQFVKVTVTKEKRKFQVISSDGSEIDSFEQDVNPKSSEKQS